MDVPTREGEIRARMADIGGADPSPAEQELMTRLIRSFVAKTPAGVDRLAELLRGGDRTQLRDHAHALKGSASNLGADTLASIFAEVEEAARDGSVPDPDVTLGRVAAEQALVLGLLEKLVEELGVTT